MENLTKSKSELFSYVLGIAAKSNVEKRQVGCIIVNNQEQIVAEGFNIEFPAKDQPMPDQHAEAAACEHMRAQALDIGEEFWYTAYVTHAPCPECAKMLTEYGIKEVIVVDAFMKFDGDKTRFDLVNGLFALHLSKQEDIWNFDRTALDVKEALWMFEDGVSDIELVVQLHCGFYKDFFEMEEALANVLTFGARKYKANNWKKCTDTGRYLAAAHRHLNAIIRGELNDPETGLFHEAHVMCNLMFLFTLGLKY